MIDIFNKKRIKRMTEANDALHHQIQLLKVELRSTRENQKELEQEISRYNRTTNDLINGNAKLIDWIQGILKVAKVYETKNTLDVITIPIQKNIESKLDGLERPYTQTDILIPSIRFSITNVDYDIDSTWIR